MNCNHCGLPALSRVHRSPQECVLLLRREIAKRDEQLRKKPSTREKALRTKLNTVQGELNDLQEQLLESQALASERLATLLEIRELVINHVTVPA